MILLLIVFSLIIFTCIFLNNLSQKAGIPVLLLFILFGLIAGNRYENVLDDYSSIIGSLCTVALIFVMFYGGFGTRWQVAKPVIREAGLLASVGVILTALSVGLFCHFALGWALVESFLMGSVICSTDAATVFSILRTRNVGLRKHVSPILEIESGSNDPCSYMLTAIFISVLSGVASAGSVIWTIFAQLFFGAFGGFVIAQASAYFLKRYHFTQSGFDTLFIFAVAIAAYALPSAIGGNGYLSVYIVGIVLGNINFPGRKPLIPFFDAVTDLMQIVIFFLLGFMAIGHKLLNAVPTAILVFLFVFLVARPVAVFSILAPFRKYTSRMMAFVSFVGLRGAASIVFAIMILSSGIQTEHDIFSIVFVIVLISIAGQGSLIPKAAQMLKMIDPDAEEVKTFEDFSENDELSFGKVTIREKTPWRDKTIKELGLPRDILLVRVIRGRESIVPDGDLKLVLGDVIIVSTRSFTDHVNAVVHSVHIEKKNKWIDKKISDFITADDVLVIMVKRKGENLIPNGRFVIEEGDILMTVPRSN